MTKNYDSYADVSAEELRELFLNDAINTDLMGLDEYERLFGYEMFAIHRHTYIHPFRQTALRHAW